MQELVKRVLIEGCNHRLGDVGKEVIDPETRTGKRIDPVVDEQAADDELHQEIHHLAGADGMRMKSQCHRAGVPIHNHADELEERNGAQLRHSQLSQSTAILGGEIRQVIGELVEPVHARACGR